mgnify:CR=1 FL=1
MTSYKTISIFVAALFAMSAHAAPTANAVKKEPVQIKLEQFKVLVENGKETLAPIQSVKPGEVIEYRATYKNVSTNAVKNLVATIPVPKNTEYQAKTASPLATAEASIDNVTFGAIPLMDAEKKQPIPTKQYRALRWKLQELGADKSIVVSARMKVNQE